MQTMNRKGNGQTDKWTERQINKQKCGQTERWSDRQTNGLTDKDTDGQPI